MEKWMANEPSYGWYSSVGIGKPGCIGHIRKGVYHALDMGDHWLIHKEYVDPAMNPLGHLVLDAPQFLWGLGIGALLLGALLSREG